MTVHARRIASIPRRTATETWQAICEMLTTPGSPARQELQGIVGIASALITEEYLRDAAVIVSGAGPQVRIYTLHGEAAIEADPLDETPLSHDPTGGDWKVSLPCGESDLDEARDAVNAFPHVEVRSLVDDAPAPSSRGAETSNRRPIINLAALEQS
jgi:hypothetical protein